MLSPTYLWFADMFTLAIDLANLYTYQSFLVYFYYYVLESNQAVTEIIKETHYTASQSEAISVICKRPLQLF